MLRVVGISCFWGFVFVSGLSWHSQSPDNHSDILFVFDNETVSRIGNERLQKEFDKAYQHFEKSFDFKAYSHVMAELEEGAATYRGMDAYTSYTQYPDRPHCDKGVATNMRIVNGLSPFPGGATKRTFGFDAVKLVDALSQGANGPASAGMVAPMSLARASMSTGMGIVQAGISSALNIVPPKIPPPAWNNLPLPCVPMVTGHNCFGAVLYPITAADFVMADITDAMMDGILAGFPATYARKVGKTGDKIYKSCGSAYLSMHCSSLFPMCTSPQGFDDPMPGGRVPMCLHLCVVPLVMCPGFWIGDVIGTCTMVSVPPMCTQAFFWMLWKLPPQYVNFDEANPFPKDCPRSDFDDLDGTEDPALYDAGAAVGARTRASPIMSEAYTVKGQSI